MEEYKLSINWSAFLPSLPRAMVQETSQFNKKECPHCRSETFTHIRSLPLKRKIDDVEVYCPNQQGGCKEIMKLGVLDDHKWICHSHLHSGMWEIDSS